MFAAYCKEREDVETLQTANGFALYQFLPEAVYLQDIYVLPESRNSGYAQQMEAEVIKRAKAQGLKRIIGSVCTAAAGVTVSLKVLLASGYEFTHQHGNMIYFAKAL